MYRIRQIEGLGNISESPLSSSPSSSMLESFRKSDSPAKAMMTIVKKKKK